MGLLIELWRKCVWTALFREYGDRIARLGQRFSDEERPSSRREKGKFWRIAKIDGRADKRNVKRSFTIVDDVSQRVDHTENTDEPSDHFMEVDGPIKRQKPVHSS